MSQVPRVQVDEGVELPNSPGSYSVLGRWRWDGVQPTFFIERVEPATRPTPAQHQDSITDQLRELAVIAEREHGMYDAADWIRQMLARRAEVQAIAGHLGTVTGRTVHPRPNVEDLDPRVPTVLHCPGCGRPYSERGYVNKTEIGCTETYAATGESPVQAFCVELDRYV